MATDDEVTSIRTETQYRELAREHLIQRIAEFAGLREIATLEETAVYATAMRDLAHSYNFLREDG